MVKYRVVKDNYSGFEVQQRFLWIFWKQSEGRNFMTSNTFSTLDEAKEWIKELKKGKQKGKQKEIVYSE